MRVKVRPNEEDPQLTPDLHDWPDDWAIPVDGMRLALPEGPDAVLWRVRDVVLHVDAAFPYVELSLSRVDRVVPKVYVCAGNWQEFEGYVAAHGLRRDAVVYVRDAHVLRGRLVERVVRIGSFAERRDVRDIEHALSCATRGASAYRAGRNGG